MIVLLKAVLANVTALITHPMGGQAGGLASGYRSDVNLRNGQPGQRQTDPASVPLPHNTEPSDLPIAEIEAYRSREITSKAVSGILLILLKWFKVSRKSVSSARSLDTNWITRCLEIRISDPVIVGFELSSSRAKAVCSSRC